MQKKSRKIEKKYCKKVNFVAYYGCRIYFLQHRHTEANRHEVGFIGGGNMASAMIGGMIQKGVVSADDILVSVRTEKSVERLTNQFGVQATMENEAVVAGSDLVFLAVKQTK